MLLGARQFGAAAGSRRGCGQSSFSICPRASHSMRPELSPPIHPGPTGSVMRRAASAAEHRGRRVRGVWGGGQPRVSRPLAIRRAGHRQPLGLGHLRGVGQFDQVAAARFTVNDLASMVAQGAVPAGPPPLPSRQARVAGQGAPASRWSAPWPARGSCRWVAGWCWRRRSWPVAGSGCTSRRAPRCCSSTPQTRELLRTRNPTRSSPGRRLGCSGAARLVRSRVRRPNWSPCSEEPRTPE